jgi:hypothetical protein
MGAVGDIFYLDLEMAASRNDDVMKSPYILAYLLLGAESFLKS